MNNLAKSRLSILAYFVAAQIGFIQSSFATDAASPVTAAAIIDWSKLQVEVTGIDGVTPTVTFANQNTSLSSYASSPGLYENDSRSVNNWTATADTNADAGTTYAHTLASPLSFSGNANSMDNSSTSSSGNRTEGFYLSGPGILTVTVPYTISLTGDVPPGCYYCYNPNHASVSANASFTSYVNNGNSSSNSSVLYSLNNSYTHISPQSQSGTLVFGIFANSAGSGSLGVNFDLSARPPVSSVPEPESYAMLLAGLCLMGAVVRRRSDNKNT